MAAAEMSGKLELHFQNFIQTTTRIIIIMHEFY